MALTISRAIRDSASTSVLEVVSDGTPAGETGTIVAASDLNNAKGDDTELLRVVRVQALVQTGPVILTWDGDDEAAFLTLPAGSTDMKITCDPTDGDTTTLAGEILYSTGTSEAPFTLRLTVEKIRGFTGSTAVKWFG